MSDRQLQDRVESVGRSAQPRSCSTDTYSCQHTTGYLLNYLDRTNLGNARTLNSDQPGHSLVESLGLKGDRYNFIVAIFFV